MHRPQPEEPEGQRREKRLQESSAHSRAAAGNGHHHPRLAKRLGGMVRPSGTRRSVTGRPHRLEQAKSLSVAAALVGGPSGPNFAEFEEILSRMVDRIVKFLQAEKCVFLLYDNERSELQAVAPARGISSELLPELTSKVRGDGLAATVFSTGEGVILHPGQVETDPRAVADRLGEIFGIRSSLSVPLFIETRGAEGEIVSRESIGVAHVFNKTTETGFTDKDMSLLIAMSRNAASIINSARAFREVVTEKQELIQTLDSLYVGLIMVGLDGRIIQMNPPARSVLAVEADRTITGLRYEAVVHNATFNDILDKALAGIEPIEITGEVSAKIGNEERIYQAHCAPVKDQELHTVIGLLILLNDITDIRSVDRMKTAFISTVSHELRTPLTSIKGFIATLLADNEGFYDIDTQREFYRIIDTECDRLTRLIDDLLNVSRIEQGRAMQLNLKRMDIRQIVEKVLTAQRAYVIGDRHVLEQDFPEDFPELVVDADKIDQILTNLVSNAIKYSPKGGQVKVAGAYDHERHLVTLQVSDCGMGIPREHIKKVFERFHRVDNRDNREIGGTGIGLFLVKALSEAHHGSVRVDSEFGQGSTFTVTLPITQPTG
jgi:signal transduction histidine kinase